MTDEFFQNLQRGGLEYYNKYYSLYPAKVTSVADPLKRGRVQIQCAEVGHDQPIDAWVDCVFDGAAGDRGYFWPPEVGDYVRVAFDQGNVGKPLFYMGSWYANDQLPAELGYPAGDGTAPTRRGFVTKTGHFLVFDDEQGKEGVTLQWNRPKSYPSDVMESASRSDSDKSYLKLLPDGSVELQNKNGSRIKVDAEAKSIVIEDKDNSNVLTFDSEGVKLSTKGKVVIDGATSCAINADSVDVGSSASKSAVYGEDLLSWLASHTHGTAVGPSTPPVKPPDSSMLSTAVKVK